MRLHILCEGQTEEGFVNAVLRPHLANFGVYVDAQSIPTRKNSNSRKFKGGWNSYPAVKQALLTWMKSDQNTDAWFTTMLDLYGTPSDFPRFDEACRIDDRRKRIVFFEETFKADIGDAGFRNFTPYLQLHEFEALIFADASELAHEYPEHNAQIARLVAIAEQKGDPEMINDSPETAPSKRILNEIPEYRKVGSGAEVTGRIGVPILRERCRHFGAWLSDLERLADGQLLPAPE